MLTGWCSRGREFDSGDLAEVFPSFLQCLQEVWRLIEHRGRANLPRGAVPVPIAEHLLRMLNVPKQAKSKVIRNLIAGSKPPGHTCYDPEQVQKGESGINRGSRCVRGEAGFLGYDFRHFRDGSSLLSVGGQCHQHLGEQVVLFVVHRPTSSAMRRGDAQYSGCIAGIHRADGMSDRSTRGAVRVKANGASTAA
jgi:hypothetical protein